MPPLPKPAATRQRRNKTSTRATLPSESDSKNGKVPALPKRRPRTGSWHPRVVAWWQSVWRSPMASEFLDADRPRLEMIAELHQKFWMAADEGESVTKLAGEIRQQELLFGLTPMDRRRLQWEVEKGESAAERTTTRKARKTAPPKEDPRTLLKVV